MKNSARTASDGSSSSAPMSVMRTLAILFAFVAQTVQAQTKPIFRFHTSDFWLNLHQFLYVLGRAENRAADATREAVADAPTEASRALASLSVDEQARWRGAVSFYAKGPSRMDLVFDDSLIRITRALSDAADQPTLRGAVVDSLTAATLERIAPLYRRVFWTTHRDANVAWVRTTQTLIDKHGTSILAFIVNAYGMPWPGDGYPVHMSGYAGWAGAYSTSGNLLVMASRNPSTTNESGLETVFHEAMHQWDDSMFVVVRNQAQRIGKRVPNALTHAMIFYTAGAAVKREIPNHIPYADAAGVWGRGMTAFKAPLEQSWQAFLDGKLSREEALARVVAATATPP